MVSVREPILHPIDVDDLRPTQITVGMREVEAKRKAWRGKRSSKAGEFLGKHMIPVIRGPKDRHYVIDHHHLARALHDEGVKSVLVTVVKDRSVKDLVDDPFRSLAGELRRVGGFAKDTTPFSEFLWADFLRRRMKRNAVETDFAGALEAAAELAKGEEADYLPGWCGVVAR